jgi:hypothetical protein
MLGKFLDISLSRVCRLSFPLYRMSLQETLDTYSYFITEADKLNLAYITLVRYHPSSDVEFDGTYFCTNLPDLILTKIIRCETCDTARHPRVLPSIYQERQIDS